MLSVPSLKLLARIQRRRKVYFFKVSDLELKYQKDLTPECNIWEAIDELQNLQLIYLISPRNWTCQTTNKTTRNFAASCVGTDNTEMSNRHQAENQQPTRFAMTQSNFDQGSKVHSTGSTSTTTLLRCATNDSQNNNNNNNTNVSNNQRPVTFDPLYSVFSLSLDELKSLTANSRGGILSESVKQSRRQKLSKIQLMRNLIKTANGKKTRDFGDTPYALLPARI